MPTPETWRTPTESDTEPLITSPHMEHAVTQVAQSYGVDLTQVGSSVCVERPGFTQCWLIANIDGTRIGVTRCQVDTDQGLVPELDMVFAVTPDEN